MYLPTSPGITITFIHSFTYNGESTAAAISFLGAADNAKRNENETTRRMIIASAARLTGRASQWYETMTTSDLRPNVNATTTIMLDKLPDDIYGWKYFSKLFLDAFTTTTETFDLRDQLKNVVWIPEKIGIKQLILTMTKILHCMALGDHLTDRDKVEHFMSSLVNKSYLVKKINLSPSFDQACRDVIEFCSKEKIAETIMLQHKHRLLPGVKLNNIEPFDDDYDFETMSRDRAGSRFSMKLDFPVDRNLSQMDLFAMQMDWVNNLTPEEKRRFDNQLCIGCGQPEHLQKDCPTNPRVFKNNVKPKPNFQQPQRPVYNNNGNGNVQKPGNAQHNRAPQHNMGG
jgi:hypothetical protein